MSFDELSARSDVEADSFNDGDNIVFEEAAPLPDVEFAVFNDDDIADDHNANLDGADCEFSEYAEDQSSGFDECEFEEYLESEPVAEFIEVSENSGELYTSPHAEFEDWIISEVDDSNSLDMIAVRTGVSGTVVSVALHLWLVFTFAGMVIERQITYDEPPLETRIADNKVEEEPEEVIDYELANPDDKEYEVREVVNATSVGQAVAKNPQVRSAPTLTEEILPMEVTTLSYDIPEGMEVDDRLVVKGTTGEAIIQIESALDRVTWEIAKNLQERKVLVIWLLDASGSLVEQRQAIAKRLRRIYGELGALADNDQIPRKDKPLLSGVVTFGERTKFITPEPTDDFETIQTAMNDVVIDESGVERGFEAVGQVVNTWKKYRTQNGRRIMVISVTDEAGDDFSEHLEPTIARCRKYGARAYVIGPAAVFGRREGFIPYVAPENGRTYNLPIDLGPETPMMTNVSLPFWYNGPQYTYLSSGYAPYALARLVSETGGVYFMTNMTTMAGLAPIGVFDSVRLKPFMPDYSFGSLAAFEQDLAKNPIRRAVVNAARLSMDFPAKGTPGLSLRVTPQQFKEQLTDAQKSVAESQLMIDNILTAFPPGVEKFYDREPSARWRMSFSLAYGRLLAQRVRCLEYNFALAHLKNDYAQQDIEKKVNQFVFHPDENINYAANLKRAAQASNDHLRLIIEEAPGTPWAVLAARELQHPLGMRIEERFIPPVERGRVNANTPTTKRVLLANEPRNQTPQPRPKPIKPNLPKL